MPNLAHQNELTDAASIPRSNLAQTVVGMAHFAGTGPFGATCAGCKFWSLVDGSRSKKVICHKYAELTGDRQKAVPSGCAACRYFEAKA